MKYQVKCNLETSKEKGYIEYCETIYNSRKAIKKMVIETCKELKQKGKNPRTFIYLHDYLIFGVIKRHMIMYCIAYN
jgi:hypothetical protein